MKDETGEVLARSVPIDQIKIILSSSVIAAPAAVDNANRHYVIEKILDHREKEGQLEYYVKWKGYPLSQSTWENEHQFNDTALIDKYFRVITAASDRQKKARVRSLVVGSFMIQSSYNNGVFVSE